MAGVAALGLLAGCGQSDAAEDPAAEALPTVRMWGIGGITDSVRQRIQDHLNELTREKLGFEVELTMVSRNSYNEQLNIAFFQGNAPDLFAIYQQTAFDDLRNGGYLCDLHDYTDEAYLSSLNIPRELWNRTRSGESCYGIVQYSETMQFYSYQMQRATAQQYGVADTGLWGWDELHTLLAEMKRRCPEQYPLVAHYGTMLSCIGQDSLGNDLGVLIDESAPDTTVVNLYATEQYRTFCTRMHAWYQEGLILPDTYEGQMSGWAFCSAQASLVCREIGHASSSRSRRLIRIRIMCSGVFRRKAGKRNALCGFCRRSSETRILRCCSCLAKKAWTTNWMKKTSCG
jgi:putative aldouronate transport system substrate-binding protein